MYNGLDQGVKERGGTASIAFHGKGHVLRHSDRMVYGALQEWLRQLFVDDCRVKGRDRRILVSEPGLWPTPHLKEPHARA